MLKTVGYFLLGAAFGQLIWAFFNHDSTQNKAPAEASVILLRQIIALLFVITLCCLAIGCFLAD